MMTERLEKLTLFFIKVSMKIFLKLQHKHKHKHYLIVRDVYDT